MESNISLFFFRKYSQLVSKEYKIITTYIVIVRRDNRRFEKILIFLYVLLILSLIDQQAESNTFYQGVYTFIRSLK